ncbi:MAG: hypothetical protein KAW02_06955 [candidate division Zixibacteria bacterium]|nr:hypothetical protein [candidate division Zixibacteria bacterium]
MFQVGERVIYIKDEESGEQVFAMVTKDSFPLTIYTDEGEELEVNPDELIPLKKRMTQEELEQLEWEENL